MPVHAAGQLDDCCLNQECHRRMREREIAVGNIAERDAIRILEGVAEIPQDREVRVLPNHDHPGGYRQHCRNQPFDRRC